MGEAQSRYGIMEELNNRKINEKEKLANIERETDQNTYNMENGLIAINKEIQKKEESYEIEHKNKVRQLTVQRDLIKSAYERDINNLNSQISEEEESYVDSFNKYKESRERDYAKAKEALEQYTKQQSKKIEEKKSIIAEIENGITSLKEMSKEQKGD